jgi:hypothetical protein
VPCQQSSDCSLVSSGRTFCDRGRCIAQLGNGEACSTGQECASGQCILHYHDDDDDDYAAPSAATASFCTGGGFNKVGYTTRQPGALNQTDCLEGNANVFPGQANVFTVRRNPSNPSDPRPFDYDCDGVEQSVDPFQNRTSECSADVPIADCQNKSGWALPSGVHSAPGGVGIPRCGEVGTILTCMSLSNFCDNYDGIGNVVRACK